jgi:hypothetical protein
MAGQCRLGGHQDDVHVLCHQQVGKLQAGLHHRNSGLPRRQRDAGQIARYHNGHVELRWAPADFGTWQRGNQQGYLVERYEEAGLKLLTPQPIRPLTLEEWATKGMALTFSDPDAKPGKTYGYRIRLAEARVNAPDTTRVFVETDKPWEAPQVQGLRAENAEHSVMLKWNKLLSEAFFTAFWVEKSTDGGNAANIPVSNSEDLIDAPASIYSLTVTDKNSCTAVLSPVTLLLTSGAQELPDTDIRAFPNPVHQVLTVEIPATENVQVQIFNATGQMIETNMIQGPTGSISVENWSAGSYYLVFPEWSKTMKVAVIR